ncbi:MAG: hypothetical protein M1831_004827 [Alyxoria varia]|nr:MAG: hypothetical protein M1831_004827 [Alyxoria varia]
MFNVLFLFYGLLEGSPSRLFVSDLGRAKSVRMSLVPLRSQTGQEGTRHPVAETDQRTKCISVKKAILVSFDLWGLVLSLVERVKGELNPPELTASKTSNSNIPNPPAQPITAPPHPRQPPQPHLHTAGADLFTGANPPQTPANPPQKLMPFTYTTHIRPILSNPWFQTLSIPVGYFLFVRLFSEHDRERNRDTRYTRAGEQQRKEQRVVRERERDLRRRREAQEKAGLGGDSSTRDEWWKGSE